MSTSLFQHDPTGNKIAELMNKHRIDTMIGLPSWQGGLEPDTQTCLDKLLAHNVYKKNLVSLKKSRGSMISENRNNVIKDAIKSNVQYVLFIDTDMIFPEDAIQKMQALDKPVVSALAFSKSPPYVPNMYRRVARAGWVPITKWTKDKVLKADCIGGAFILVKVDVLRKIESPWFASPSMGEHVVWPHVLDMLKGNVTDEVTCAEIRKAAKDIGFGGRGWEEMGVLGEDYYFSEKLRRLHIPIHVDTSMQIGHVGKYTFSYWDFKAHVDAGILDDANEKHGFGVLGTQEEVA